MFSAHLPTIYIKHADGIHETTIDSVDIKNKKKEETELNMHDSKSHYKVHTHTRMHTHNLNVHHWHALFNY